MNNKGFTLIELLVTIALLAVLSIIAFVSVNAMIQKSRVNDCNSLKGSIETAAKEYVSDNRYNNTFINKVIGSKVTLNAKELINSKYLTGPIVNPFTKKELTNPQTITVTATLYDNYTVKTVSISGTGDASFINECNG